MSAVSNMVRPASRQMSTSRVTSATSLEPHALKKSLPPPKVPVPKLRTGTLNPEPPSCLYSIFTPPRMHLLAFREDFLQRHFPLSNAQADYRNVPLVIHPHDAARLVEARYFHRVIRL